MSWLAAALLVCSQGDPMVITYIVEQSQELKVPPALSLAVGCMESGNRGPNPMGVMACYRSVKDRPAALKCIRIGVLSLKSKLPRHKNRKGYERTLRRYNNSRNRVRYGKRGYRIMRVVLRNRKRRKTP